MLLKCLRCQKEIPDGHIQSETMIATCPHCNTVFDASFMREDDDVEEKRQRRSLEEILPKKIQASHLAEGIVFEYPQNRLMAIITIPLAIIFNLLGWGWFGGQFVPPMAFFGVLAVFASFIILFNSRRVYVDTHSLRVRDEPIPAGFNVEIKVKEIQQLFVRKKTITKRRAPAQIGYELWVLRHNGKVLKLMDEIVEAESALSLEKHIEDYLGIENRKMKETETWLLSGGKSMTMNREDN